MNFSSYLVKYIKPNNILITYIEKRIELQKSVTLSECLICNEQEKRYAFVPCGHVNLCEVCYFTHRFEQCPTCDTPVTGFLVVYLLNKPYDFFYHELWYISRSINYFCKNSYNSYNSFYIFHAF